MMKNLLLLGIALLITSCCCTNTQYVQYRAVAVTPVVTPVVAVSPIVTPVVLDVDYPGPLDVTTTTIDYY